MSEDRSLKRLHPVPHACDPARVAACLEFPTGRRSPFINPTGDLPAYFASQGGAAHRHMVSAPHAAGAAIDLYGQTRRDATAHVIKLVDRKVDPKAGAAGTTGQTGMRGIRHEGVAG